MVDIWMIFGMVIPFCEIILFVLRARFTGKDDNGIREDIKEEEKHFLSGGAWGRIEPCLYFLALFY